MEICPYCNKMTAQKDLYTGEIICYDKMCYETKILIKRRVTAKEYRETQEELEKYLEELLKEEEQK